jgi:two-component system sensor histidine kinase ResE
MFAKSIVAKLWLSIVLLMVIIITALGLGLFRLTENFYYSQITKNLVSQGLQIADMYSEDPDIPQDDNELSRYSRILGAHILLLDEKGTIKVCNMSFHMIPGSVFEESNLSRIFNGEIIAQRGYHNQFGTQMLTVGVPVKIADQITKALLIYTPVAPITATLNNLKGLVYWALLGSLLLASILAFIQSRSLSRPLVKMNQVALGLAKGDYSQRITVRSNDEIGVLGASLNYLTEQLKENISALSYEKEKFENILLSMTDGVIVFDTKGSITLFNPQAKKLLAGCSNIEKDEKLEHCSYLSQLNSLYTEILVTKKLTEGKIAVDAKTIAVKLSPLFEVNNGELCGVIAVLQDITQEQKLEEMRREFIANVSHELRTPICLITGYSEAIIDGVAEKPEERHSFMNIILDEANRLKRLVEELLELSRLQSGAITINKEWVDIEKIVEGVQDKFCRILSEGKVDIQAEINPQAKEIWADRFRLEQIIINLVSNAVRYAPGGVIKISSKKSKENTIVRISDTGRGIPDNNLPFIFERFYRADKSRNRESGGTGLGLAIVKNLVDVHNGTIEVDSREGEGTVFTIALPDPPK